MQSYKKILAFIPLIIALLLCSPGTMAKSNLDTQFNDQFEQLNTQLDKIEEVKFKLSSAIGEDAEIVEDQLQEIRTKYQHDLSDFAVNLGESAQKEQYLAATEALLEQESAFLKKQIPATRDAISAIQIKLSTYTDNPAPDELVADVVRHHDILTILYGAMLDNISAKGALSLPIQEDTKRVNQWIQDQADLLVGRAELIKGRIEIHKQRASIQQADSQEYKDEQTKIKSQQLRLEYVAKYLGQSADLLERLGQDGSAYEQAVIRATGKLSGEVLDVKVMRRLFLQWGADLKKWALVRGPAILTNITVFLLIMLLASFIARMVQRFLRKALTHSDAKIGVLARDFIVSVSSKLVMVIGIIIALSNIGVQLGPVLAGFGILGFIVGFALQDTLSNFASGLMILIYRPYDVGDYIEAAGVEGEVRKMSLVATTVYTVENHRLMLPNNKVWGNIIRNVTSQRVRRVDLTFGVAYDEDIDAVKKILHSVLEQHDKVLKSPEAVIRVHELADSSVNFVVRPWVPSPDYWEVYWDLTEQVKKRFDEEGVVIPYPQQDVHLSRNNSPSG